MISLVNLSVQDKEEFVIETLNATFHNGYIYGLYAQDLPALQILAECIEGRRCIRDGAILSDNQEPNAVYYALWNDFVHNLQSDPFMLQEQHVFAARNAPAMPFHKAYQGFDKPGSLTKDYLLYLLHDMNSQHREANEMCNDFLQQEAAVNGKTVLITGSDYSSLRELCDYIYVFDNKQFQVKVERRDYHLFDHYLENVFRN